MLGAVEVPRAGPESTDLLDLAREHARRGRLREAWCVCLDAADRARAAGDISAMAEAATLLTSAARSPIAGEVHRLCLEALAANDGRDDRLERTLRAQLEATRSPWERATPDATPVPDPDAHFLELLAEHEERTHVDHVERRLALGDAAVALGHASGTGEYVASGLLWRMTALTQLGRRVELEADLAALAGTVGSLDDESWTVRLDLARAALRLLDGRFADCRALVDGTPGFLAVVMRSHLAVLSGDGLAEAEQEVRDALDGAPFFARGWHAVQLVALGRLDEARALWRAIAPHVGEFPRRAPEWLIGAVGHARLAVALQDLPGAQILHEELEPYAHLHASAGADTPSYGPVTLHLGRLARVLGRTDQAVTWLEDALRTAEALHDLPSVATAHLELARTVPSRRRADAHLSEARRLSTALPMAPLGAEVAGLASTRSQSTRGPLSPRETEIAALVADGAGNREIADRLRLSVRTVENHVRHVMLKTEQTSRTGVAAWYLGGRS
jgi:DNA-binding CsgD family transcriptional regulator/tetratricopeptide (TPR) repeat protein